jgi:hypothetical protein
VGGNGGREKGRDVYLLAVRVHNLLELNGLLDLEEHLSAVGP